MRNLNHVERHWWKKIQDKIRIGYADTGKQCKTRGEPEYYCSNRLYLEKSKKTFIHENLETDDNTDSSGKTGNGKSILELDEVNQMAEMTKSWNHEEYWFGGGQMAEMVWEVAKRWTTESRRLTNDGNFGIQEGY